MHGKWSNIWGTVTLGWMLKSLSILPKQAASRPFPWSQHAALCLDCIISLLTRWLANCQVSQRSACHAYSSPCYWTHQKMHHFPILPEILWRRVGHGKWRGCFLLNRHFRTHWQLTDNNLNPSNNTQLFLCPAQQAIFSFPFPHLSISLWLLSPVSCFQ